MRVLIVDDEPTILDILRRHLAAGGADVVAVADGEAALAAWRGGGFDAVVSDIQLPTASGIDVLRTIRASGDEMPCLLISGHVRDVLDGDHGLAPAALLRKPFTMAEFDRALGALVEAGDSGADGV